MEKKPLHTPTPWRTFDYDVQLNGDQTKPIGQENGYMFAFVSDENLKDHSRRDANADLIVRAVNNFDDLLTSLKRYHAAFGDDEDGKPCPTCLLIDRAEGRQ